MDTNTSQRVCCCLESVAAASSPCFAAKKHKKQKEPKTGYPGRGKEETGWLVQRNLIRWFRGSSTG